MSLLLLLIFVMDATITVWRRGDRRQALIVGGSILLFTTAVMGVVVGLVIERVIIRPLIGKELEVDDPPVLGGPEGAAARLGMERSTLHWKMKKLGISRPE